MLMGIFPDLFPRLWIVIPVLSVLLLFDKLAFYRVSSETHSMSIMLYCDGQFDHTDSHQSMVLAVCLSVLMPVSAVTATWLMVGDSAHAAFSPLCSALPSVSRFSQQDCLVSLALHSFCFSASMRLSTAPSR